MCVARSAVWLPWLVECIATAIGCTHRSEMKLKWDITSAINLYTVHDVQPLLASTLLPALGAASHAGITRHYVRPLASVLRVPMAAFRVIQR